jgi:hypothetical protein
VRALSAYDLASIAHPAAYINHVVRHYSAAAGGVGVGAAAGAAGAGGPPPPPGHIRLVSTPIAPQAMLAKCGPRVFRAVEEAVGAAGSSLQWAHFDSGVCGVLAQLARLSEGDVIAELEALGRVDLGSLQHVPAYLNKRLNNRLWQKRKGLA